MTYHYSRSELLSLFSETHEQGEPPDLSGFEALNEDYHGLDLGELDLTEATFTHTNLTEANLRQANLMGARFLDCTLVGTNLAGTTLYGVTFMNCNLTGANLSGANLAKSRLTGVDLSKATLIGTSLIQATLVSVQMQEADLAKALFIDADCYGTRFTTANLREANCTRANLERTELSGADLTGAILSGASLKGACLSGTQLAKADLCHTRLPDLSEAAIFPIKKGCFAAWDRDPTSACGTRDDLLRGTISWWTTELLSAAPDPIFRGFASALGIGDTLATSQVMGFLTQWVEEWYTQWITLDLPEVREHLQMLAMQHYQAEPGEYPSQLYPPADLAPEELEEGYVPPFQWEKGEVEDRDPFQDLDFEDHLM